MNSTADAAPEATVAAAPKKKGGGSAAAAKRKSAKPMYNVSAYGSVTGSQPTIMQAMGAPAASPEADAVQPLLHNDDNNIVMKLSVYPPKEAAVYDAGSCHAFNEDASESNYKYLDLHNNACELEAQRAPPPVAAPAAPAVPPPPIVASGPAARVVSLLKEFEEKSKNDEWPATTQVCCYWCCHAFDCAPIGIPVRYVAGKFHSVRSSALRPTTLRRTRAWTRCGSGTRSSTCSRTSCGTGTKRHRARSRCDRRPVG
jgi:hypothetical protein